MKALNMDYPNFHLCFSVYEIWSLFGPQPQTCGIHWISSVPPPDETLLKKSTFPTFHLKKKTTKQMNQCLNFFRILTYCCPSHPEWFSLCLTLYRFYFLKDSLLVNDPELCYSHFLHPGILELFLLSGLAYPEISLSQCQTGWVWSTEWTRLICEMKHDDGSASAFPSFYRLHKGLLSLLTASQMTNCNGVLSRALYRLCVTLSLTDHCLLRHFLGLMLRAATCGRGQSHFRNFKLKKKP